MTVEVFSRAEVSACSEGDNSAWAKAYSNCAAAAYAKVWASLYAKAFLDSGCMSAEAASIVKTETGGDFYTIEGCQRYDYATGNAGGSTTGSTAEAFADDFFPSVLH